MKLSRRILHLFVISVALLFIQWDCDCNPEDSNELALYSNLFFPEDGVTIQSRVVEFVWGHPYAVGYIIEVDTIMLRIRHDTASAFSEIPVDITYPHLYYEIDSLEPATTYYWNVYATATYNDTLQLNHLTRTRSFTMADRLLDFGELHSPTPDSGATGISVNPNFSWDMYNPEFDPYDFNIFLGTSTDPPLLASDLGVLYYNLTNDTLNYATLYYWQVEAFDDADTFISALWEFTTDYLAEDDIFAMFEIDVMQSPSGYHTQEDFRARFDSGLALNTPIKPLQADSVLFEDVKLDWISDSSHYSYFVMSEPVIQNGLANSIIVYGNSSVPDLNINVTFPACTLAIVSPESFENVPNSGFEVTWDGSECGGNVWLMLLNGNDSTGVSKEVVNDGLDSLTASDLVPLGGQTGSYDLYIVRQIEGNIDAAGYRSESLVRTRVINRMLQIDITSE